MNAINWRFLGVEALKIAFLMFLFWMAYIYSRNIHSKEFDFQFDASFWCLAAIVVIASAEMLVNFRALWIVLWPLMIAVFGLCFVDNSFSQAYGFVALSSLLTAALVGLNEYASRFYNARYAEWFKGLALLLLPVLVLINYIFINPLYDVDVMGWILIIPLVFIQCLYGIPMVLWCTRYRNQHWRGFIPGVGVFFPYILSALPGMMLDYITCSWILP